MRFLIVILCWMLAAPKFPVQAQNTLLLLGAGGSSGGGGVPVAFDAHFEKGGSSASPFSFVSNAGTVTGTVGNNANRCLIAFLTNDNGALTTPAVTWNSVSMTSIGTITQGAHNTYVFGLVAPATGNQTISGTWAGGTTPNVALGAISVYNANQTTCWRNFGTNSGTSTGPTITVSSTSGNMVVGLNIDNNSASGSITAGTQDWREGGLDGNYIAGHIASVGSSATLTATLGSSVAWVFGGLDIQAAP